MTNYIDDKLKDAQGDWNKNILCPYQQVNKDDISQPFYCTFADEYAVLKETNKTIMIVGKETNRGYHFYDKNHPWTLISKRNSWYDYFIKQMKLTSKRTNEIMRWNRSAFWKIFRCFAQNNVLTCWNNINKCERLECINGKECRTTCLNEKQTKALCTQYGYDNKSLLQREIEIVNPDIVLLMVGNSQHYIQSICTSFGINEKDLSHNIPYINGVYMHDITNIVYKQNVGKVPKVIWTYHPSYLQRAKKLDNFINNIIKQLQPINTQLVTF